jgi:lysophospholipase L1-like esterase
VTVDLGYNNLLPCLRNRTVDQSCVSNALVQIRQQLLQIVLALQSAGGPRMQLIGVGHNDPFLGAYLLGPSGQHFAVETLGVFARFNDTLRSAFAAADVPMAGVANGYATSNTAPVSTAAWGTVPVDVSRICHLTWMCAPPLRPNIHPNAAGYRVIADAINAAIAADPH